MTVSNKNIEVRKIRSGDWDDFFNLEWEYYNESAKNNQDCIRLSFLKKTLVGKSKIKQSPNHVWVAHSGGVYAGHIWGCVQPLTVLSHEKVLYICSLLVLEQSRGDGVGAALVSVVSEYCKDKEFTAITLLVKNNNLRGKKFYKKMNFKPISYLCSLDLQ